MSSTAPVSLVYGVPARLADLIGCRAGYILVNRVAGARLPGAQGPAAAAGLSALLYVPAGIWALASHPVTGAALGRAATADLLCSAVPIVADLLALLRVPARLFGVFMSVNPGLAVLTGLIILGQSLELADWLAVAAIVTASAVSVSTSGQHAARPALRSQDGDHQRYAAALRHAADPSRTPGRPDMRWRRKSAGSRQGAYAAGLCGSE